MVHNWAAAGLAGGNETDEERHRAARRPLDAEVSCSRMEGTGRVKGAKHVTSGHFSWFAELMDQVIFFEETKHSSLWILVLRFQEAVLEFRMEISHTLPWYHCALSSSLIALETQSKWDIVPVIICFLSSIITFITPSHSPSTNILELLLSAGWSSNGLRRTQPGLAHHPFYRWPVIDLTFLKWVPSED